MKKLMLWLLMVVLLIGVLLGGVGYYFYSKVGVDDLQPPTLLLMDQEIPCTGGDMQMPVLAGVTYKRVAWAADREPAVFTSTSLSAPITAPDGVMVTVMVRRNNETLFDGTLSEYAYFTFAASGMYDYKITAALAAPEEGERPRAYGSLVYECRVQVKAQARAVLSAERVAQGDVLAVRVTDNLDDTLPTGQSELGELHFIKKDGNYTAYLAIPYNQETGEYPITVTCGELHQELAVTVNYTPYTKVQLDSAAALPDAGYDESAAAREEYRSAVWPLYERISPEAMWDGKFTEPINGTVPFDYGTGTLLPGQKVSTRHSGRDYTVNSLASVVAPGAGQVVFSGYLKLTGNTVIIEHGGGVKSHLYHLTERTVQTGEAVTRGQTVATLGTVAEGATAHFEVRIGNKSVSPAVFCSAGNALLW